ncbi:hypothetical protein LTR85_010978 [Meristemomyces frigidus]|nr:hypothetical protein LTR85_010978 [Meristemomyces frigidus]
MSHTGAPNTSTTPYQPLEYSPVALETTYLGPDLATRACSGGSESTLYDAGAYASLREPTPDTSATLRNSYDRSLPGPPSLSKTPSGKWGVTQSVRRVSDAPTRKISDSSSGLLLEKEKVQHTEQRHHRLLAVREWWLAEIGAALLSLGCMVAVAAVLLKFQNRPLSDWRFPIAPNSLLSVLLTVAKTLLLLSVAESTTQLKWNHFARQPRPLRDFQVFDDASKGPWGAVQLLWHTRGSALLASVGALIILLSLAMDPFAQQILAFTPQLVPAASNASVPVADHYGALMNNTPTDIDYGIQRAVYGGLFATDAASPIGSCVTGNCTFEPFHTLGVCSQCRDISMDTTLTCQRWYINSTIHESYTCQYHSPSGSVFQACSLYGMRAPESCFNVMQDRGHTKFTSIANTSPNLTTLVNFAAITIHNRNDIQPNKTMKPGTILECSINWCAKEYANWTISESVLANSTVSTSPLAPSPANSTLVDLKHADISSANYTTTQVLPNMTEPLTFGIGGREQSNLKIFLANIFTTSLSSANASANWPPVLNPTQQITMASALFQANGGNIRRTMSALATSLEAQVRQGQYGKQFAGTAWKTETYIRVKRLWLILPTFLVLLGILFLLASLVRTWMAHSAWTAPQWKSSSIAPLFHGLEGLDGNDLHYSGLQTRMSMEDVARTLQVQLKARDGGEMRSVRSGG